MSKRLHRLQRLHQRTREIEQMRLSKAKAAVDTSEPEHMHRLDFDPKKEEAKAERQYEIDAVSSQGGQHFSA
jgi:hypothetical protein